MRKKIKLVLIGAGGHARSCIDVVESTGKFDIAGIIDIKQKIGQKVSGYSVIGNDDALPELCKTYGNFLIAVGQLKMPDTRKILYRRIVELGAKLPGIIASSSYISKSAFIGEGTIVMHNVFVNAAAKIGRNCIINTAAVIEHDSVIGDNCHISTSSVINGGCVIGDDTFIGSNSVVSNNVIVPSGTVIGAGSSVIKPITKPGLYAGNPAKFIKKNDR